jgi:transposase
MRGRWELSDAQWEMIEPMLGPGAQWRELPEKYPSYQTCHRRFQQWVREGKVEGILRVAGCGHRKVRYDYAS